LSAWATIRLWGVARHLPVALDTHDGLALEHDRRTPQRLGAAAVDQGATAHCNRHPSIMTAACVEWPPVGMRRGLAGLICALVLVALLPAAASAAPPVRDDWYRGAAARTQPEPVYRTQRDGSRYASSNCGPASLGMVLDAYGATYSTLGLRQMTHTYQGTWPGRGGTALQYMAQVAEDFAVPVHGLYDDEPDGPAFHRWSIDEVAAQLQQGRWVIPLVRYNLLPGHETTGVRTGHYIVLYAIDGNGFTYDDPAYDPVEEGDGRWISRAQLDQAMDPVLVPRQAMALGN
jgi:hypothetical protein